MALNKREQNVGAFISIFAIALLFLYLSFFLLGINSEMGFLTTITVVLLSSASFCLLLLRKYRKAQNALMIDYLNIGTQRYILAILMAFYGIDKLLGNFFDYQLFALDTKLSEVSEFQLAWYFYGKNRWQELFTGIMEFVPGLLLLHRRTYYVAALILLPVTAQVFLLNFFFKIGGITFPAAIILLACNSYILYSQKEKIILFFRSLNLHPMIQPLNGGAKKILKILKGMGIVLILLILFIRIKPHLFRSAYQKKYQSLVGVYSLTGMTRNGITYQPGPADSLYYKDLYIEKQSRWNILKRADGKAEGFLLQLHTHNDSLDLYINKGGIGDDPDVIDTTTALKGVYKLKGNYLSIKALQAKDTLLLNYEKQERLKPKQWFW